MNKELSVKKATENENIYLNIDHLNKGKYTLNILLNNEIIKSIDLIKK